MAASVLDQALGGLARLTGRFRIWHRLPFPLSVLTLLGLRANMREDNLFNTERDPSLLVAPKAPAPRDQRSADGSFNDLSSPWMGMAGARFGRNMPIDETFGERAPGLYTPNPRTISRELLARREFIPVPHLNVLVPAWLQFMVHDWLSHGPNDKETPPHDIALPEGDEWPEKKMQVLRTKPDPRRDASDAGRPETYRNTETHWWDASQIYGSSRARQIEVRSDPATGLLREDGKIHLDEKGHLPIENHRKFGDLERAGMNGNWWIGLSVMHTLFAREHNAIVDRLRIDYPTADGEWLFQKARLVNAALIAKIHTVEWTPALLNSPDGRLAMRTNWWGVMGESFGREHGRFGADEVFSGIPGSPTNHHAAPYALTEEFTAVYRMHSLLPDHFSFRRHADDAPIVERDFKKVEADGAHRLYAHASFDDALYSLATSHAGALVLHNFPNALRRLNKKELAPTEGIFIDLATVDVLRDRERGVPRYCAFRRHLGMSAPKSFEELTDNPEWRRELKSVYASVEDVDLLVGVHAETPPPGFGFSDTAFRIFILMASRRLKSDRFFTTDFTPAVYTPVGFDWIRDNTMRSVLARHAPALQPRFAGLRNVFFPWDRGGT
ncbi:MAG TPA: peroxidase family protein [Roseiarcus sp.]|nr:peroxidase family protein [Roseiarcus sp.]